MPRLVTRYIGRCGVCEGDYKLLSGKLVHHGYRRPGYGSIVGDCFGVGYAPLEVSTEASEEYRAACEGSRAGIRSYLQRLNAGEVNELTVYRREGAWGKEVAERVRRDADDPEERRRFERAHEREVKQAERQIEFYKVEIGRMTRIIDAWIERPIRTVEEFERAVEAVVGEERRAREAERAAKREAREEKRRALDAKRERWGAERQALIDKYRSLLIRLAQEDPPNKLTASSDWRAMHAAMERKGYLHFYPHELDIDDYLIRLGLAERVSWGRGIDYARASGVRFT